MSEPEFIGLEDVPYNVADEAWLAAEREGSANGADTTAELIDPTTTVRDFVSRRDETTAEPLVIADQGTLLPAAALALLAAKTGDGKTTIVVELVLHAGSGLDYLGLRFSRPLRVLLIENEGPREAFREKLERRLAEWPHDVELVRVWDEPATWGAIRALSPELRGRLRAVIERHNVDLVVADTLTRFGVRGNGTPEETREFVEWLTELGLGRDVAFLLLHHPRTRAEAGETDLERISGAWNPHADLVVLLSKLAGNRARLAFPKARWARSQRPTSILAFEPASETFTYVGDEEHAERDYADELAELMADGEWRTMTALRKPKPEGIGADPKFITPALADERFESTSGDAMGKRRDWTFYRRRPPHDGHDGHDGNGVSSPKTGQDSPSSSKRTYLDDDGQSRTVTVANDDDGSVVDELEIERLAELAREDDSPSSELSF